MAHSALVGVCWIEVGRGTHIGERERERERAHFYCFARSIYPRRFVRLASSRPLYTLSQLIVLSSLSLSPSPPSFTSLKGFCIWEMGDEKKAKPSGVWTAVKPFVNGGTSGMLATCVIQPVDMVKVNFTLYSLSLSAKLSLRNVL